MAISRFCNSLFFTINFLQALLTLYSCLAGQKHASARGEFWKGCRDANSLGETLKVRRVLLSSGLFLVFSLWTFCSSLSQLFSPVKRTKHQVLELTSLQGSRVEGQTSQPPTWLECAAPKYTNTSPCWHRLSCVFTRGRAAVWQLLAAPLFIAFLLTHISLQSPWQWRTTVVRNAETLCPGIIQMAPSLKALFLHLKELLVLT